MTIEQPKYKKLVLDFLDEMTFDVIHTGKKNLRDESFVKFFNSTAIRAGSLRKSKPKGYSTRVLSSNPNELCDRLELLLQRTSR